MKYDANTLGKGVPEIKTETSYSPAIPGVPEHGTSILPNGCTLYWDTTDQGREYYSDEVGGGVHVWSVPLVDSSTLLAAMVNESTLQRREIEIIKRLEKENKNV